jgi:hypothetical protein
MVNIAICIVYMLTEYSAECELFPKSILPISKKIMLVKVIESVCNQS